MKQLLSLLVCLISAASAQQPAAKPAPRPAHQDPSLVTVADEPGLPRVLLIGDSISMGYTLPVRELLKGKANLHRIPDNGGSTRDGLTHLAAWLGDGKWDVIHFNWGLHDLKHMKDGKLDLAGDRVSTPAEYEANLRELVKCLRATGARLIWAATTPVPAGADGRAAGDELQYNEAASRVMKELGVPVNDLHALCLPHLADWQLPQNVHFKAAGYAGLAAQVAAAIQTALQTPGASHAIPADLPRPDGQPGDATKPVKVYVLAGQSNMVGMGDLTGTRPVYPSVFLSADPALVPGPMPVGHSVLAAHGVYQSAEEGAAKGAKVSLYQGACDPKADYSKLTPARTATVELGTVARNLPALDGPHTVVVSAFIDVPAGGSYTVHAGFEDSACSVVVLDGKEVYRREPGGKAVFTKVPLDQGKRYPVRITYFKGGSAAFWLEQVDLEVKGDLETVTRKDKKFQYLLDDAGKWTVRNDVYFQEARLVEGGKGCPLSAMANSLCLPKCRSIGPEVGFGYVMGTFHDEQVLLIKTAQGNRSLGFDFRPPSCRLDPKNENEGMEYRLMLKGVRDTLAKIDKIVPGYQGQGYEIAGFGWFQGHKDMGSSKADYEKNLVNLIHDLRRDLHAPKMRVVVATVGFHGYRLGTGNWNWKGVWEAQMAVGDPQQHPEFAGTVASVDTRDFWREVGESPGEQDYHYNRNAETYMLVGEAMGRAMVRLQGGQAAAIPKSDREARTTAMMAAEAANAAPTDEQKAASLAALKPMILDGALVAFADDPRNQSALREALKQAKHGGASQYVDDILDEACDYYRKVGIHDYDWKPIGKDMMHATWDYYGFNLPKVQADPKAKFLPVANVVYPAGMENWFAAGFDARKAGWKTGAAPFGEKGEADDKRAPATVTGDDVLLLRQTFDLPPLKPDCRYRIHLLGSAHKNMGEGYAIYINGKLLAETKNGVVAWHKEGHKPRGNPVWPEFRDEFKGGKVTIAVSNFPMSNFPVDWFVPARDALSVCVEEMKLPPLSGAAQP